VDSFDRMEEKLPYAGHVFFCMPGGMETARIVAARHLNTMTPGAYLYNLGAWQLPPGRRLVNRPQERFSRGRRKGFI